MSNNSLEIVHEGWLTKSPPSKPPILRARWRRRWFVLRHSGELPGQYFLEYYTDHNRRKLKGKIDLDQCEQVDAGLRFESRKQKYQFMFDVKTPKRVYYLAAESEEDMNKWVEYVCHVCGLKAYKDDVDDYDYSPAVEDEPPATAASEQEDLLLGSVTESPPVSPTSTISGPYIPISECISGKSLSSPSGLEDFLLRQGGYGLTASMQYGLTSERILLKSEHKVSYYSQNRCLGLSRVSTTVENTSAPGKIPALPSKKTTAECDDAESSGYYDSPRNLHPPNLELRQSSGSPPLHSPATDGESVFTDEECPISAQPPPSVNWETFPNAEGENVPLVKPSASSSEVGHAGSGSGTWGAGKKSGRHNLGETAATVQTDGPVGVHGRQLSLPTNLQHPRVAPPRPPKPVHLLLESPSHNYLNLENVSPQSRSRRNVRKPSVSSLSSESSKKTGAPASSNDCISASDGNEEPPSPLSPLHSNNDDLDEMYDFPRSHQYANNPSSPSATSNTESKIQLGTRHCYTNAAPSRVSGEVFRYDFHHTDAPISVHEERTFNCSEEPISPLSDGSSSVTSSSTAAIYSNLPSPSTMGTQSSTDGGKGGPLTPPIVNRELKPGRKLSDSTSAVSNEPSPVSPAMLGVSSAFPPSVDRKLKPPQLRQPEQEPLSLAAPPVSKADNNRSLKKNRAAPSPTPPCSIPSTLHNGQMQRSDRNSSSDEEFRNSQDDEPIYYFQHENNKFVPATRFEDIQYLDLDLEDAASGATVASQIPKSPEKSQPTSTVYKTVDFVKTEAFNRTRQEVEKDRNKCTAADQ